MDKQRIEILKRELAFLEKLQFYQDADGLFNTPLLVLCCLFGIIPPILVQQIYRNYKKKKLREKI